MKRKNVVHVTFNMDTGGAERVISELVRHASSEVYDVAVLCLETPVGAFGRELREEGYHVDVLGRRPGFDVSLIGRMRNYVRERHVDILHCHQYTPYVYGVLGAAMTRARVIFTEHGRFYPDRRKLKRIMVNPLLNLMTDRLVCISEATRQALGKFENFPVNKIEVIYNGINDMPPPAASGKELRAALGVPENALVLGTVARLDPIKNHKMMIRALKTVHESFPDTRLLIVGDGPERDNLEMFAIEMGVGGKVVFAGMRDDAHNMYAVMDMFLLTSFSEGTAMTLLEAMAASLACIATDVGGNPEIVADRETGFLVSNDDADGLAKRICELCADSQKRRAMGAAGRKRYLNRFTVENMVKAYELLYEC